MTLKETVSNLGLEVKHGESLLGVEVSRGYMSDLLSDVIANSRAGDLWITLQIHPNIVAVAVMKEISGILIIGGRQPEEETLKKAEKEEVPILSSELPAFEVCGRLYSLGVRGI